MEIIELFFKNLEKLLQIIIIIILVPEFIFLISAVIFSIFIITKSSITIKLWKLFIINRLKKTLNLNIKDNKLIGVINKHNIEVNYNKEKYLANNYENYIPKNVNLKFYLCLTVLNNNKTANNYSLKIENKLDYYINKNSVSGNDNIDKYITKIINKREIIARLSSETIGVIKKIHNKSKEIIIEKNYITIRLPFRFSTVSNIKNKINNILDDTIILSEKLSNNIETDKLLLKNIETEKNQSFRLINMKMLLESKNLENYKDNIKKLVNDRNSEISIIASCILQENTPSYLIKHLESNNKSKILLSLKYLQQFNINKLILKNLYNLLNTDNKKIITTLCNIFIKMNDINSIKYIIDFIKHKESLIDKSIDVRYCLVLFIKNFKTNECLNWLIKQLNFELNKQNIQPSKSKSFIIETIKTLSIIGNIKAVEYLIPITKGLKSTEIKKEALNAIYNIQKNIPEKYKGDLTLTEIENIGKLSSDNKKDSGRLSINIIKENDII